MTRRPLIGLISSYREGLLGGLAAASLLDCCDFVLALEGPIGPELDPPPGDETQWPRKEPRLSVVEGGPFKSDADKRTQLIQWAQRRAKVRGREWWAVILDGDEELLWPRALPAYLYRAEQSERGAMKLKLCEADGQVYETGTRCLPGHEIVQYLLSSYQIELTSGVVITLPHTTADKAPIMGEPHILHRAYLRPPERNDPVLRLSEHERAEMGALGMSELIRPGDDKILERIAR